MKAWSKNEDSALALAAGDAPWPLVATAYNQWAAKNGYPVRSDMALMKRVEIRGWRRRAEGAWLTTGIIAKTLGLSYRGPEYWITACDLPATRFGEGRSFPYYIKRSDLIAFARQRKDLFAGYPRSALFQLLEDEALANQLSSMSRQRPRKTAVQCVETGRRYRSIAEAARTAAFVSNQRLRQVLDHPGRTANGLHWISA